MRIILDHSDSTHEATLLAMLREHNRRFTNDMTSEAGYLIAKEKDTILGMLRYTKSWNWVGLKEMLVVDDNVLSAMIHQLWRMYPDMGGIQHYTEQQQRVERLCRHGFVVAGRLPATTQVGEYVYLHHRIPPRMREHDVVLSNQEELSPVEQDWWNHQAKIHRSMAPIVENEKILLVAIHNDEVVGGIVAFQHADTIHVWILVVSGTSRKNGIGRALMTRLEEESKARGVVQINLGTTTFQAKGFYERLGYQVVMTQPDFPKGYDCFTMVKDIR